MPSFFSGEPYSDCENNQGAPEIRARLSKREFGLAQQGFGVDAGMASGEPDRGFNAERRAVDLGGLLEAAMQAGHQGAGEARFACDASSDDIRRDASDMRDGVHGHRLLAELGDHLGHGVVADHRTDLFIALHARREDDDVAARRAGERLFKAVPEGAADGKACLFVHYGPHMGAVPARLERVRKKLSEGAHADHGYKLT